MKIGKNIQNKKSAHFDNKIGTVGKKKLIVNIIKIHISM